MAERPAVNASPLIFLAAAELLELLHLAGTEIVVPSMVAVEIRRRGPADVTVQALRTLLLNHDGLFGSRGGIHVSLFDAANDGHALMTRSPGNVNIAFGIGRFGDCQNVGSKFDRLLFSQNDSTRLYVLGRDSVNMHK